jgi:hypothetical protein
VPTRYIEAARKKMETAKRALEECQENEPLNIHKARMLFKELTAATNEYVAAVDAFIARSKIKPS